MQLCVCILLSLSIQFICKTTHLFSPAVTLQLHSSEQKVPLDTASATDTLSWSSMPR